jgi:hypothetical protein
MDVQAGYEEGHLLVAGVRVLTHRNQGRPPTVEEIAELIGLSREWTGVMVSSLERAKVLHTLTGPFETRVEIADHLALEKLPRQEAAAGVDEELRQFAKKKRREETQLKNLFSSGKAIKDRDKKIDDIADAFKSYKPRGPRSSGLFKDEPPGDE